MFRFMFPFVEQEPQLVLLFFMVTLFTVRWCWVASRWSSAVSCVLACVRSFLSSVGSVGSVALLQVESFASFLIILSLFALRNDSALDVGRNAGMVVIISPSWFILMVMCLVHIFLRIVTVPRGLTSIFSS